MGGCFLRVRYPLYLQAATFDDFKGGDLCTLFASLAASEVPTLLLASLHSPDMSLSKCETLTTSRLAPSRYTPHTTHYSLHTTHYSIHTTHYTLHTAHYTPHTTHYTLHTSHYALHTTHYTLHNTHCTLHSSNYTLHTALHTAHYTLHTSTLHTIHFFFFFFINQFRAKTLQLDRV